MRKLIKGKIAVQDGRKVFVSEDGLALPTPETPAAEGAEVTYGIRPEHLDIADDGIEVEVAVVEPTGSETQIVARIGTQEIIAVFRDRHEVEPGDRIHLRPRANLAHLFDKDTGRRL